MLRHIHLLVILIEIVYLYAWASGAIGKFAGMPRKLKFYQKKSAERLKKLGKLIVDNYVMRNVDSSPSRRRFLSLYRILYLWLHTYIHIFIHTYIHLIVVTQSLMLCLICPPSALGPQTIM